jgi:cytochrome c biogenesis factor
MEFITLKAVIFPFINLLWIGSIVMVIGFVISIFRRNKENKIIMEKLIAVKHKVSVVLQEPYPEKEEV